MAIGPISMVRKRATKLIIAVALAVMLLSIGASISQSARYENSPASPATKAVQSTRFPRKVWQTWQGSKKLEDESLACTRTWIESNTGYGYELLTDETAREYILSRFPDILQTWDKIDDYILKADLIRYLALLGDGGIYTDTDTDCTKPIEDWLSAEHQAVADVVVGLEYDGLRGQTHPDMYGDTQLCTWTIMAKPRSQHLQNVVDQVLENLRIAADEMDGYSIRASNTTEVLKLTGPGVFTSTMIQSMTTQMGQLITATNLTMLDEPTLFGTVLVMPVSSFASGQYHSASKPFGNEQQLLAHHFSGIRTWRPDYPES